MIISRNKTPQRRKIFDSPLPLYFQLENILRRRILEDLESGSLFPSECALSREFKVSRVTVRRALDSLARDGLVRRAKGKGTLVGPKGDKVAPKLTGFIDDLMAWKHNTKAEVLERMPVKAAADVATNLGLSEGEIVVRIKRIRYVDKVPLAYIVAHFPNRVGLLILDEDLEQTPIVTLLATKFGVPIIEAKQTIEAALADGEIASLLDVRVGAPLLRIDRVYYTNKGEPVDYVRSFYRGDRYQFAVALKRGSLKNPWEAV